MISLYYITISKVACGLNQLLLQAIPPTPTHSEVKNGLRAFIILCACLFQWEKWHLSHRRSWWILIWFFHSIVNLGRYTEWKYLYKIITPTRILFDAVPLRRFVIHTWCFWRKKIEETNLLLIYCRTENVILKPFFFSGQV